MIRFSMYSTSFIFLIASSLYAQTNNISKSNVDYVWVLYCTFLVFIMQAGFMCLEAGMARAKHSINVAVKNLIDFLICATIYWMVGFGLMFGESFHGILGTTHFFASAENDSWTFIFMVFQIMFAGTAATIVSGAVAERIQFKGYIICTIITSTIIYPVYGHWVWGSIITGKAGWLESLGFIDFAGSTVVHSIGGWIALACIIVIGPRFDKFTPEGNPRKIFPYNLRLVYLGVFLLFFGWFGFNGGSTLSINAPIGHIILNTIISGCIGGLSSMLVSWLMNPDKYYDAEFLANGVIGGLVGITAGCAFISVKHAAIVGFISGIIVYVGSLFIERVLKLDDVVGAVSVHALCGVWGTIATALFMNPDTLVTIGKSRFEQIMVQMIGILAGFLWAFSIAFVTFKIMEKCRMLRVPLDHEYSGLNVSEHGAHTALVDLTKEIKKFIDGNIVSDSITIHAEEATEAADIAKHLNVLFNKIHTKHSNEKMTILQEKNKIDDIFNKFLNPRIKEELLRSGIHTQGQKVEATILLSDIRNFTVLTNYLGAEKTVEFLNNYFSQMSHIITKHGGFLDKYIGDAIMAIFSKPFCSEKHADNAVLAAFAMNHKLKEFNDLMSVYQIPPIQHGIGICSGEIIAGVIGSDDKMEYTAIGNPVNIASRMESLTKKFKVNIIISQHTYKSLSKELQDIFIAYGTIKLKGEIEPFKFYLAKSSVDKN